MGWSYAPPARPAVLLPAALRCVLPVLPGLAAALLVAVPAALLGALLPVVGGPVFGIAAGAAAGPLLRRHLPERHLRRLLPGFAAAGKQVLQASVVVLGAGLSLGEVVRVGGQSLPVMAGTLTVALGGAWALGRLLGVHREAALLIGVGTGICGASAIAAVTAVTGPAKDRVAYALGTIFTFNIAAVLLFPPLGHLLGLSQEGFGLWSGTAVNDTSSVVAASYAYGATAGAYAVVVKLTRSLMIVPVCLVLQARKGPKGRPPGRRLRQVFPLFILAFLAASTVASLGGVPASWHPQISALSAFLITVALTGIGLSLDLSQVRAAGVRPLLLGALLWLAVATTGLGLQVLTGQL
ncbi:putative sulfate exporter family transporter [Streptomyces sp. NBC_01537]|uniref:YeiH family protein n=1 Tax=Streptomyces sp. NBC_01537 TaxID=2903896 RepID=UPI00386A5D05